MMSPTQLYYKHYRRPVPGTWSLAAARQCYDCGVIPVTKTTPKRFYVTINGRIRIVDRETIERDGKAWCEPMFTWLYLAPPVPAPGVEGPGQSVSDLRRRVAAAHPDRGGDPDDFIRAHAAYRQAKAASR